MADTTIVNTPASQDTGMTTMIIAFILVAALIGGGFVWYRYYRPTGAETTNINVTIPNPATGGTTQ